MSRFINRREELKFLDSKYSSKNAEMIILYGRRRIGKTELVLKFCDNKIVFYFMGRLESREDTLKRLNNLIVEKFKDSSLLNNPLSNLEAVFDYLAEKCDKRLVLVFDEFPFLVDRFPEVISLLQDKWDSKFKKTNAMFILLGSSVGMMEKYALDYKSPLYGRRTGQWKIDKFNISHLKSFFPKYSVEDLIYVYSTIDSIPGYLGIFDENKTALENIQSKILSKGEFLYEEVEILLREELRDPSNYMSIISAVAGGLNSFNEISQKTNLDKSMLSKYLGVLENLNIIERISSLSESSKAKLKSKNLMYVVRDNFYDFWFKFVYLNKQNIEKGSFNLVSDVKRDFEQYVSFKFEDFSRKFIENLFSKEYNSFGKWWFKDKEIDILGLNEATKEILFAECKWKKDVNALDILRDLADKSKFVDWNLDKRKETFVVFAKSFSKKVSEFEERKVYCYDLKDIEEKL